MAKKSFIYPYPRPALTVDVVLVSRENSPRVLLIRRKGEPFAGQWAFPGGFVNESEPLHTAALRELHEETGLHSLDIVEVGAFGDPGRDPRGWTVSVAYAGFVDPAKVDLAAGDDAEAAEWHSLASPPELAFDHAKILAAAVAKLGVG